MRCGPRPLGGRALQAEAASLVEEVVDADERSEVVLSLLAPSLLAAAPVSPSPEEEFVSPAEAPPEEPLPDLLLLA